MSSSDPIRRAWQESVTDAELPPLDKLRRTRINSTATSAGAT